jgi:predicted transposase YbfD/YdcC
MHWGVENSLNWTSDMTFREDEQRKRDKNSAQNFAIFLPPGWRTASPLPI